MRKITHNQQVILSLLVRNKRELGRFPTCGEISEILGIPVGSIPTVLRSLDRIGAISFAPPGVGREGKSYDNRITLLWDEERVALGGAEQRMLWRES